MVEIKKVIYEVRLTKDRKNTARETIFKIWENETRFYVNEIEIYNLFNVIRKIAASMGYYQAILKIN
jgi:hypothetical protein